MTGLGAKQRAVVRSRLAVVRKLFRQPVGSKVRALRRCGHGNRAVPTSTAYSWRRRFLVGGLAGLVDGRTCRRRASDDPRVVAARGEVLCQWQAFRAAGADAKTAARQLAEQLAPKKGPSLRTLQLWRKQQAEAAA